jgi:SAM-dependent methyltransferase
VRETVAAQLLRLNSEFYQTLAGPFGETRRTLQPGVVRALQGLEPAVAVLDLGCGPGTLARELARRAHRGPYLGIDSSEALLARAGAAGLPPNFRFRRLDVTQRAWRDSQDTPFDAIFAFALFHHIPGEELRARLASDLRPILAPDGTVVLSVWDFLASGRLRARIQPWEAVGLSTEDVDPGDYLLDWRRGGHGFRYVHHFTDDELRALAARAGFEVREVWRSDGEGGRLGLYQRWAHLAA